MPGSLDVVGIGNALVDVLTHADDEFIAAQQIDKGAMTLIGEARAHELYDAMGPAIEVSGGSGANTAVGVASFGGRAGYIGKIRDDHLGDVFTHDIRSAGVEFDVPVATVGDPTGRCLILVTPDGQRTMSTYLGASVDLAPADVDPDFIARAKMVFLEGYLWDPPAAMEAMAKAARLASSAGQQVALSLSDSFCVDRHRDSFLELISRDVNVLFANEREITSLFEVDDTEVACERVRSLVDVAAVTMGRHGSLIVTPDGDLPVDAHPVELRVDSTAAGDLYAAGFMFGLTHDKPLARCGELGSRAAAEVITHMGARPETPLDTYASELLL